MALNPERIPRAIVIDDSQLSRAAVARTLIRAGFDVVELDSAVGATLEVKHAKAEIVIVDMNMPVLNGPRFIQRLRRDPELNQTRIIMVSGEAESELRQAGQVAGADAIIRKSEVASQLAKVAFDLIGGKKSREVEERPMSFLVVDDDLLQLETARRRLEALGFVVYTRDRAFGTLQEILERSPDCVLLDVGLPGLGGDQIAKLIADQTKGDGPAVILHSSIAPGELNSMAHQVGALGSVGRTRDSGEFKASIRKVVDKMPQD